ncbi:MAG: hypothetical protein ABF296_12980 [Oceanococcaceae bacterium]
MSIDFLHNLNGYNVAQLLGTRLHNVDDAAETTLAGELGASNAGLIIFNTDAGMIKTWDGTQFVAYSFNMDGDVVFKGTLDASVAIDDAGQPQTIEPVAGYQYVVSTAGTFAPGASGVTLQGNQALEVGDMVLFTSATEAYSIQRNDVYATETVDGNIRLATQAEVDAGAEATEAVTPATLQGKLDAAQYVRGYTAIVNTTALTPATVNHALNLVDPAAFTVNVMDSSGNQVNVDVDAVDADNLTLTTLLGQTDLRVTVMGFSAA